MGSAISKITEFDVNTYTETEVSSTPIKAIVSALTELMQLLVPYASVITDSAEVLKDIILNNKVILEAVIVLVPTIPFVYLVMYLLDTL